MIAAARLFLVLAVGTFATTGCETTKLFQGDPDKYVPERGEWQETEPLAVPSLNVLWERVRAVLEYEGYGVDEELTRFDRRELVSTWVARLAPTRFEGVRRRAHVTLVPAGDRWVVRAAIVRQRNTDIDEPSNPAQAQWESTSADASRTAVLVFKIRAGFDPALSGADPLK